MKLNLHLLAVALLFLIFPYKTTVLPTNQQASYEKRSYTKEDITWMANNVYHEARGESLDGQLAVIFVTLNRLNDSRWPATIKEIVTQRDKKTCQFSWYCMKSIRAVNKDAYEKTYKYVESVLKYAHTLKDITNGAVFYHANYVNPKWNFVKEQTAQIGTHVFYR